MASVRSRRCSLGHRIAGACQHPGLEPASGRPGSLRWPVSPRGVAGVASCVRSVACGALAMPILLVRWLPRKRRTLHAVFNRRTVAERGVAARKVEVRALLSNQPINPTHSAASCRLLAQAARRGSRAGYRQRYTDTGIVNDEAPRMKCLIHGASPSRTRRTRRTSSASVGGWHARRPLFTQATQSPNTLVVQLSSRHWQALAGVDAQNYVEDFPYNHAVNASVRPVTPLAVASVAPVRPARYRER